MGETPPRTGEVTRYKWLRPDRLYELDAAFRIVSVRDNREVRIAVDCKEGQPIPISRLDDQGTAKT